MILRNGYSGQEQSTQMILLRWMCSLTRRDRVRNVRIRGTVKVGPLGEKIGESRMRQFWHIQRREENYVCKKVEKLKIEDKRQRGKTKVEMGNKIEKDLRERECRREGTMGRKLWHGRVKERYTELKIKLGKGPTAKEEVVNT